MQKIIDKYKKYFVEITVLSYPIIIGQLGIVLMGVADTMMIGKLDATNLAAASLANAVYFLICILGIGTLSAVSPLVAKARGAENPGQCAILYKQAIWASLILSTIVAGILFTLTTNLHWFGLNPTVTALAKDYLHILNVGTLPLLLFTGLKQYSDGLSFTKPSAIITIIALLLNVFLNWVWIYGNLGAPAYGLFGAGLATSLSRVFMAVAMWLYVVLTPMYTQWKNKPGTDKPLHFLGLIFKVGLPSGFQYFFEVGAFAFAAIMIGWISEYAMAAHQIAINIASVTYMIATGISAGGSIAVGEALGRKDRTDIILAGRAALIMGSVFMLGCALLFALFSHFIVGLYIHDQTVFPMAVQLLWIAALFQLSDGIQCVGLGVLRGIHDTKIPTLITIVAYWVIGIPIGYYLGFKTSLSQNGIWLALLLGLSFSAVALSKRFLNKSRTVPFTHEPTLEEVTV